MARYVQQEAFLGRDAQSKLQAKTACIVGLGAVGSVSAELLTRAGVNLVIVDRDIVEESNLHRQLLYDETDINKPKALAAYDKLKKINSSITISPRPISLDSGNLAVLDYDIVLDCTDNFEAGYLIDEYCSSRKIPWIHSAAAGSLGIVIPFANSPENISNSPNNLRFRDIFRQAKPLTCDDLGIIGTNSALTASIQATEAIKILTGKKVNPRMIRIDAWNGSYQEISVEKFAFDEIAANENLDKKEHANISDSGDNGNIRLADGINTNNAGNGHTDNTNTHSQDKIGLAMEEIARIHYCKTKKQYSLRPLKELSLNLDMLKKKYRVLVDTPVALIIESEGMHILVHEYGELTFRNTEDLFFIKTFARKIYDFAYNLNKEKPLVNALED